MSGECDRCGAHCLDCKFKNELVSCVCMDANNTKIQYWEAEEYDNKRPWLFKLFSCELEAKNWVEQSPDIRKCRKCPLPPVLDANNPETE